MAKMSPIEKFFVNSPIQLFFHRLFGFGSFLKKLPQNNFENILEVGCGVGITSKLLSEKYSGSNIVSTDFDEDLLEVAKGKLLGNVVFRQEDATKLTFSSDSFDAVFAILVLHHIENFPAAISEMTRVLKPGGKIYIMDIPSKSFNFVHLRKHIVPGLFSKRDIQNLMAKGLAIKDLGGRFSFILEGTKNI